jgi:hypothetical protein
VAHFKITVMMEATYGVEADTIEEAEQQVQNEVPDGATVFSMDTDEDDA